MRDPSIVANAFSTLGLEQGASLEVVKTTYKQIALRTHPDKNPDNPGATEEFQRVSEAYSVLVKHLDSSSNGSSGRRAPHPFFNFGGDASDDDYYDDDDFDFYDDDDSEDEGMDFYLWLFEQMMANRAYYGRRPHRHDNHRPPQFPRRQTPEEYQEQLRHTREQQLAAQERRKQEAIARKERLAKERERERLEAEERQKKKVEEKKARAEASRKSSEERAKALMRKAQETRSSVFTAARKGDADKVKKGIWEESVDPTGGEVKSGCEQFIKDLPTDPQEALVHIAAKNGDVELVQWLDSHSADAEERNSQGLTAFHIALKRGYLAIVNHFLETYPPKDQDSKAIYDCPNGFSLLELALESREPELVWTILEKKMATVSEMNKSWTWVTSDKGSAALRGPNPTPSQLEKSQDITQLLKRYGCFSLPGNAQASTRSPSSPSSPVKDGGPRPHQGSTSTNPQATKSHPSHKLYNHRGRGRGRGRGRAPENARPAH